MLQGAVPKNIAIFSTSGPVPRNGPPSFGSFLLLTLYNQMRSFIAENAEFEEKITLPEFFIPITDLDSPFLSANSACSAVNNSDAWPPPGNTESLCALSRYRERVGVKGLT